MLNFHAIKTFKRYVIALFLGTVSLLSARAAEVTVPGISGITFDDAIPSVVINSNFSIHGLLVSPQSLTLTYNNDVFKLFGSAIVNLGADQIIVSFGDAANPGLQVTNGNFDKVSMGLTADFNLKSLGFSPDVLSFEWDNINSVFEIYGSADVSFDSETMSIGLGDADAPGISISNGSLTAINLSVSTDFSVKSLNFSPSGLTFVWDSSTDNFEMYGGADVSFDGETMSIGLGDADSPGIEISSGVVSKINLSVSADFSVKSLNFSPSDLTFVWDSSTDNFEMYGGADVSFDGETMSIGLGDADSPGIEISSGVVSKVNLSVSADFSVKSLNFSPSGLTFQWDSGTDNFEMYGGADVSFDGETMSIGLGDADSPGIEISSGVVSKVNLSVSADFNVKSLNFSPSGLTFVWDSSTDNFEMYGGADVSFDGETMSIGLGDADSPGIEISSGVVSKVNLSVSADFNVKSLGFSPDGLTFQWDSSTDKFEMFGAATVSFDSQSLEVSLGDADAPGLTISSGVVEQINFGITADFNMKSISFKSDGLTFQWDKASDHFEIFGNTSVTFDGETLEVSLGSDGNPGIKIDAGVVDHINMGITADFDLKGMGFTADGLTFEWDKASDHFEIYGTATTSFEGESISISMGDSSDPGIVIDNNVVQHINMGVTADFKLKTLEFEAQGLTYHWDKTANQFEIYGSTKVKFDGEEIDISLGDNADPGIAVENKVIQHINMGISANIDLKAMTIKPDNLTFHYDRSTSQFEMYGSADLTLEGHDAGISLGTNANPGLVFKNNTLQHINMAITEDFTLKGLTVKTDDLGVEWDNSNDYFNFYGDIELDIANQSINADMGTSSNPGMQFRNGSLHSFDVIINSDFKIGNLEVITRDVEVKYQNSKFYLTGEIEIDEVWSVIVDLGENGSNGLEIDTSHHPAKLKLTDFRIEVDHVDLGAIDFKKVEISFQNDVIHDAELDVSIPPGYEVDAKMTFEGNPAVLNSIDIAFDATSFSSAIPIGDTGIELVHLEGGMFNLANPNQTVQLYTTFHFLGQTFQIPTHKVRGVYFEGSVGFTFGGPVSLAGHSAALLYQETDAVISGSGVSLGASLLIGAYRSGSHWRSILGEGSIGMNLIWNRSYSVNAHMKIPSDPLVDFNAAAKLSSSGNFDALVDVKLKVPNSVPIVGGKTLGSVDGGIRYNPHHLSSSYGAGWSSYWFFGTHYFGARYKFSNRKVDVIGSGTVDDIKREISRELGRQANTENDLAGAAHDASQTQQEEWVKDVISFEVPPNKSSLFIEVDMGEVLDEVYVSVIGPEGFYDIHEIAKTEVAEDEPPLMELNEEPIIKFEADSAVNLLVINHEPEDDSLQHQFSTLAPGNYDLLISYKESNDVDSVGVRINYFHPTSFGEVTSQKLANGLINLDMNYWAHFPDSIQLSVFWNDTLDYSGHHIATLDYGETDEFGFGETNLVFNPNQSVDSDSIYFYFVLQDSSHVPVYSEITAPIKHESPVIGTVNVVNSSQAEDHIGIMVFIDENEDGFYDTFGTNGAFEPSIITDDEGKFHFNSLVLGQTYTIDVVVPYGYSLADGETGKRTFVYNGQQHQITFNLQLD